MRRKVGMIIHRLPQSQRNAAEGKSHAKS